ncbi:MAG: hypothetical protein HOP29_19965 [Phycisphaerales bacterium]|nr:hypothetical protein [Phycisphaerales bacterium]
MSWNKSLASLLIAAFTIHTSLDSSVADQFVFYVDASSIGSHNGDGWSTAYTDLQDALEDAELDAGDEIWVANGTYKPSVPSSPK